MPPPPPQTGAGVDLDAILEELGPLGRHQLRTYCLILVPVMLSGVYSSQYIFSAADVEYRCQVPECEADPPRFSSAGWGPWALPPSPASARCERRVPVAQTCTRDSFLNRTQRCHAWVYRHHHTIVAEFGLACQPWRRALVGTVHSAGTLAALGFTGFLSDTYGRRTAFILSAASHAPTGLLRALSTSYAMFVVMEFMDATLGSGPYTTGFILALEMISLNRRVLAGNILPTFFALGQVVLALVAWAVPDWKSRTLIFYVPSILFLLYFFFLEESVRWLLSKGRREEAAKIIFKAAATNRVTLSAEAIRQLTEEPKRESVPAPHDSREREPSVARQVLRSRVIMSRLCICSFWWITMTFIYYGLSINSVSLAGNMYVNYILTSLVEIPGYALSVLTLDRFGRKCSIMTSFVICGISLLALPYVPAAFRHASLCLSLCGKLCISLAFSSVYMYTLEAFPTGARHTLLAACSMLGRVGALLAPLTPLLSGRCRLLPHVLFGALCAAAAALAALAGAAGAGGARLPDTVAEAEAEAERTTQQARTPIS